MSKSLQFSLAIGIITLLSSLATTSANLLGLAELILIPTLIAGFVQSKFKQ
jgi:hypothetical protein